MLVKVSFLLTLHSKRFINLYTIFTHRLKGLSHLIQQIIIQLSYTVRIPIFWLVDLYHVTVYYDATISLTSLSWCNSRGVFRSRLKGMPQKDLINIRNYDVRHLIPKVCSAVLKNGAEILIESTVKWIIFSKLFCRKDLKSSAGRFRRFSCRYIFLLWIASLEM